MHDLSPPKTAPQDVAAAPLAAPATPAAPSLEDVVAEVFGPQAEPVAVEKTEPEPAKDAPKEPAKDEGVAKRIVAAKRAEAKSAAERAELKAQRDEQERRQADLDAREKRLRVIEEDPVRFFEEFKKDPKDFLEKLAGTYKPENVVAKKQTELETELAAVKRQLSEREAAEKHQAERQQNTAAWREASVAFVEHVGQHAEKYPNLVGELTEDEATRLAYSALNEVVAQTRDGKPVRRVDAYFAEHGFYPDHDVIAEYLDNVAKTRAEARTKSAWRQRGQAADQARQAPTGDPKPVPTGRGTSPRTLTSREASQRNTMPARRGGPVWTAEDQANADEEAIRLIEAATRRTG